MAKCEDDKQKRKEFLTYKISLNMKKKVLEKMALVQVKRKSSFIARTTTKASLRKSILSTKMLSFVKPEKD